MRIIAGNLGGQQFAAPKGHRTHPMSDKMRGALFNALGDIDDLTILDAFGGSGALSIEAASRGAKSAMCIEIDKKAYETIASNIKSLNLSAKVKGVRANVSGWSDNNPDDLFDIVLCDPPYDDIKIQLLQKLVNHIEKDGLFVLSWPGKSAHPEFTGLTQLKQLYYGDSQLVFYRAS